MQFITYILVYPFIWVISKLPFPLLYLFSDFVCFLLYRVLGYRKEVVRSNLKQAFPTFDEKKLHELNPETLGGVMEYIKAEDKKHNNLIIFDDMTAYLKNKDTLNMFKELVFNRRHMRTTIFFLVQTWHSVPKELRRLFSNIFLFKSSHDANKLLFDEVLPIIDEEKRNAIIKLVYDKPYKFLFINTGSNRLFDCWDEILWDAMNIE